MINIIHNPDRDDRWTKLMYEINRQGIMDYTIWDAIFDLPRCKGISRAHKQIIQHAKDNDLPEVIVMENDILFPAEDGYKYFLQNKPKEFDIYLGGIYRGVITDKKTKMFSGLHLYIVAQKFYNTFLNVPEDIDIDNALANLGDYHVCYPYAAIQYDGYSDNTCSISNHHGLLEGKEIYGMPERNINKERG